MARFRYQRRLGLRARVTAAFGLGALFTAALLAATTFGISREQLIRQRESSSSVPFFNNARIVQERLQAEGGVDALALLQSLQTTSGSHPVLFISDEWISTDPQFGEAALPASLRRAVLDGGAAQMRYSLDGEPELGFGISLQTADDDAAYFEIVSLDETASTLTSLGIILFGASVLATGTGAALGWWASRRALLPLAEVGSAAQAIAGGRLDTRLEAANDPDLARLTESFNEMAQALENRIARDEQFASDVSHELRSPLMTLSASIEVLKARKEDLDERAGSALDLLVADVARFEQLVNDLLEISRLEAGAAELDLDPVDPSELVLHAVGAADQCRRARAVRRGRGRHPDPRRQAAHGAGRGQPAGQRRQVRGRGHRRAGQPGRGPRPHRGGGRGPRRSGGGAPEDLRPFRPGHGGRPADQGPRRRPRAGPGGRARAPARRPGLGRGPTGRRVPGPPSSSSCRR